MTRLSATLSLVDGFSNRLNAINNSLQRTGGAMGKFKSSLSGATSQLGGMTSGLAAKMGIISGVAQSVTSSVLSSVSNMATGMISDLSSASATWQTFQGNMENMGKSQSEIANVKKELQDFAVKTIYSASDMSSTYAQLAAVGTKNTTQLVEGFGGLAAAAEDPTQAMKTLSQQATQMAAKPTVQWADFKLMLEQTPAGMAAVAKSMGKSTTQLISDIQAGTVKTQDFFDAIAKTGGDPNGAFMKMAQKYKTVGQAIDGLKEGLTNKLQPAFDKASQYGIKAVEKLGDFMNKHIDAGKLTAWVDEVAPKIESGLGKAFSWISSTFQKVKSTVKDFWSGFASPDTIGNIQAAGLEIKFAFENIQAAFSGGGGVKNLGKTFGTAVSQIARVIVDLADSVSRMSPEQLKSIGGAIAGFALIFKAKKYAGGLALATAIGLIAKVVSKMSPSQIETTAKALAFLGAAIIGIKLGNKLSNLADGLGGLFGKNSPLSGKGTNPAKPLVSLKDGLNSLAKSAGIALVIGSLAGLALALKPLASLGTTAIAPLVTFGVVVGSLAAVFSTFGKNLQTSMAGIAVFAGAVSIMALAMTPLANASAQAVPNMITFGLVISGLAATFALAGTALQASAVGIGVFAAAVSIMALSMSGIANAGVGAVANMTTFGLVIAGLVVVFSVFGTALTAAIPAMLAFGATILMVGAGLGLAAPFIAALPPAITALGTAFSMAALAIGSAISQIVNSVSGLVSQIGDSVSQIADSIGTNLTNVIKSVGDNLSKIFDSIGGIVDKVGGAVKKVLDGIANVVEKLGSSALNAGRGFNLLADGIATVTHLNAGDMANTLVKMASGLAQISASSGGLSQAGSGMMMIATGVMLAAANTVLFVAGLTQISGAAASAIASATQLQAAFSNLHITPPDMSPIIAGFNTASVAALVASGAIRLAFAGIVIPAPNVAPALATFAQVVAQALEMVAPLTLAGMMAGLGFSTGLRSGFATATSAAKSAGSSIIGALSGVAGKMFSIGLNIGQGLANGMLASLGAVTAAATALAAQADKAARAKAEVHSPSRVFMATGNFFGQGLAIGMQKSFADVANAGAGLSETAVTASDVPSNPLTSGAISNNNSSTSNASTFNFGDIIIQSSGNEEVDAEKILDKIEDLLDRKGKAGLAY